MTGPITHEALRQGRKLEGEALAEAKIMARELRSKLQLFEWDLDRHGGPESKLTLTSIRMATISIATAAKELDDLIRKEITR